MATITNVDYLQNAENRRPSINSSRLRGQPASATYQKIKRTFGHADHEPIQEKEILSGLLKANSKSHTIEPTPLSNMLNYFTMSSTDTKRKVTAKLGLDRLLS
jgi:hypothetical protein